MPTVSPSPSRNLVIVHTPPHQAESDWQAVKQRIDARAPDIEVRIAGNEPPGESLLAWQSGKPSLVFSPIGLRHAGGWRGTIYQGGGVNGKMSEIRHLSRAGLPVPQATELIRGLILNARVWGDYVIVKPANDSAGHNVRLVRTATIGMRFMELTVDQRYEMIVQRFIDATDTADRIFSYRVLTFFGRPLFAWRSFWSEPRRPLAVIADDPMGTIATQSWRVKKEKALIQDEDVLGLARRVAASLPRIPCLGVDIIRDRSSGELFVLEFNPSGHTWHFSSPWGKRGLPEAFREQLYTQFGALDIVAETLIEKTRAEAS
jgi:hypothetical protein